MYYETIDYKYYETKIENSSKFRLFYHNIYVSLRCSFKEIALQEHFSLWHKKTLITDQ